MNLKQSRPHLIGALLLLWLALPLLGSCVEDQRTFTEGRIEKLCNGSIPACDERASCVLKGDEYYDGVFPGGLRVIVPTETEDARVVVRILLKEMIYPGTEMQVQIHTPDCGDFEEAHPKNVDLFELAGDDQLIEFELDMPGRGDHLVEIYSDMSASYLLALVIEEEGA